MKSQPFSVLLYTQSPDSTFFFLNLRPYTPTKISERGGGQSTSVIKDANQVFIEKSEIEKSEKMLEMFASMSGWAYKKENWTWKNFTQFQFEKDVLQTTGFKKRNNLLEENPTSFAITATNRMEYTKFQKGVFD